MNGPFGRRAPSLLRRFSFSALALASCAGFATGGRRRAQALLLLIFAPCSWSPRAPLSDGAAIIAARAPAPGVLPSVDAVLRHCLRPGAAAAAPRSSARRHTVRALLSFSLPPPLSLRPPRRMVRTTEDGLSFFLGASAAALAIRRHCGAVALGRGSLSPILSRRPATAAASEGGSRRQTGCLSSPHCGSAGAAGLPRPSASWPSLSPGACAAAGVSASDARIVAARAPMSATALRSPALRARRTRTASSATMRAARSLARASSAALAAERSAAISSTRSRSRAA